ncbi:MAG: DNA-processing protein DprA [Candidatus Tenebribacter mawsonii]|nr:DNA-processing protein DprA [Candidatus Tenebribacter mawsonii]
MKTLSITSSVATISLFDRKMIIRDLEIDKNKFTYLGNKEILHHHKVAFFCSQKCPSHLILKSYDWAINQRDKGVCIISGFHSKIEKDVLDFLLKGTQPIIMVLARNMKKRFPIEQRKAIKENRLLVISPFDDNITQNSRESCYKRNEVILEIADEVVVTFATKNGKLEKLLKIDRSGKKFEVW